MLKLIKLEWKKNNIGKYVRNAVILAAVLCLFMFALAYLGIANDPDTGVPDAAPGNNTISSPIELFTSMSFLVFTSVMLSSFIVSAYKNKTMNLMFSYPIKRQNGKFELLCAVNFEIGCHSNNELYSPVYWLGYEIVKSNYHILIFAYYTDAGKHRRLYYGKQCYISCPINDYLLGFCFSLHTGC